MPGEANIESQIGAAIQAHSAWKLKLKTAINLGRVEASPADVRRDNHCVFGKWLYSNELSAETKAGKPYQVICRLHAEFHQCAANILDRVTSGHVDDAKTLFNDDFVARSQKLVQALYKWRREVAN